MLMACSAIAWMLCPLFFAALTDSHPSFGMPIVPGTILMSLGIDVTYPVFMIYMTFGQDESRYGIISAVCYMLGEVGIALGPTTANLALTSISSGRTSTTYGRAYWVAFGYSGVGMLLTIYWLVGSGIKRRSASLKYEGSPLAKAQSSSKSRLETTAWTAMSIERPRAVVMLSRGPQHPITYDNQAMDLFQLCRGCATGSTCSLPSTQEDSGADILLANEAGKFKDYK